MNPRQDYDCKNCGEGELLYSGQVDTPQGIKSVFECSTCGTEERVR